MNSFYQDIADSLGCECAALMASYKYSVYAGVALAIEGHNGLLEYTAEMIKFKLAKGGICVHGENLKIKQMTKDYALLHGKITGVELVNV